MKERKQTGKKADYLCSELVYCECGAKMHAMRSNRKGHTYYYYYCPKTCGAPVAHMEDFHRAATEYLTTLLSDANQKRIAQAVRL